MWPAKPALPAIRFHQKALGVRPVTAARLQRWHPARKLADPYDSVARKRSGIRRSDFAIQLLRDTGEYGYAVWRECAGTSAVTIRACPLRSRYPPWGSDPVASGREGFVPDVSKRIA